MNDIISRIPKVPTTNLLRIINEDDDAEDADVVIQQIFYEEIIFG
jgi:hypothetical protein